MINGVNEGDVTNSDVLNAVFIYNIAELSLLVPYTRIKKKERKPLYVDSDFLVYLFIFCPCFEKCAPKYHDGPYKLKNKPHIVSKGAFDIFVLGTKNIFIGF